MTVSELAIEKGRQIGRDVAFDLLLDRVSRGFGGILSNMHYFVVFFVYMMVALASSATSFLTLLPIAAVPITKAAALLGIAAWLGYGLFALRRDNRIERELLQAQINTLRLQQLAAQP